MAETSDSQNPTPGGLLPHPPRVEGVPTRGETLTSRHGGLNLLQVLATHGLLVAWFWLGWNLLPLLLYLPFSVLACLIHQRAMSEWTHEGAHHNLIPERRWNDRLTNALACCWFGITVDHYRSAHFPHHRTRAFFQAGDPDTDFLAVSSRRALRRAVLRDLCGLTVLRQLRRFERPRGAGARRALPLLAVALVQVVLIATLLALGRLDAYLIYYGTLATLYPLFNRLRVYGQHVTLDADGRSAFQGSPTSRTIDAGLLDRILHTSPRLLYHWEHHLYPGLPYRALARLCVPSDDVNRYARSRWAVLRAIYRGLPEGPPS